MSRDKRLRRSLRPPELLNAAGDTTWIINIVLSLVICGSVVDEKEVQNLEKTITLEKQWCASSNLDAKLQMSDL